MLRLLTIALYFATCALQAQTKIAARIPGSYAVDLSEIAAGKSRQGQSKEHRKAAKALRRQLADELKLSKKLYGLKLDSLERMRRIAKDPDYRRKVLRKYKKDYTARAGQELRTRAGEPYAAIAENKAVVAGGRHARRLLKGDSLSPAALREEALTHAPDGVAALYDSLGTLGKVATDRAYRKKRWQQHQKDYALQAAEALKAHGLYPTGLENSGHRRRYAETLLRRDSLAAQTLANEAMHLVPADKKGLAAAARADGNDFLTRDPLRADSLPPSESQHREVPPALVRELFREDFKQLDELHALQNEYHQSVTLLGTRQKAPNPQLMGQDMLKQLQENEQLGKSAVAEATQALPIPAEHLAKAQAAASIARKKRSWKEGLRSLFDQDLPSMKMDSTFRGRFYLAGFAEIKSISPLLLAANPAAGYRLTERLTAGLGFTLAFYPGGTPAPDAVPSSPAGGTTPRPAAPAPPRDGYAGQLFADYKVNTRFYLRGEYERGTPFRPAEGTVPRREAYRIGIGKTLNYKNIAKASVIILYDVKPEAGQTSVRERITFRTGIVID